MRPTSFADFSDPCENLHIFYVNGSFHLPIENEKQAKKHQHWRGRPLLERQNHIWHDIQRPN
jgi:hypothetical protein